MKVGCFGTWLSEWFLSLMSDETILDCLSSVLENTIITLFVMKPEGVFVLRFQLSCLIALKFNIFPLPSALEIHIVFLQPLSCVSVCYWGPRCLPLSPSVFFVFCSGVAFGWGLVFDNSPWSEPKWNSPNWSFKVGTPRKTAHDVQGHILD